MPPSPAPFPLRPKRGLRAPFGFPPGASARPFGRRAKNWLVCLDVAARYRGVSGARAAMSERTSRLCGEIQTGGLSPPLVVAEGWGFQGGRGPIRKGPFPPWRAFAFFSHEGKEGRSRRSETPLRPLFLRCLTNLLHRV